MPTVDERFHVHRGGWGQRLARDLRLIMVATKIGHDLERVGDEATAIARTVGCLIISG